MWILLFIFLLPVTVHAATISWTDTSSGDTQEESFSLEKGPSESGPFAEFATAPQDATSYMFSPGPAGSTEWYRLRGVNAIGNGSYSTPVSFTAPVLCD